MVGAANRKGQRIGSIFRFGQLWQSQQRLNHPLHLLFARLTFADDRLLCFLWSILENGNFPPRCSEQNHPFRHAEFQRALHIFHHKLRLDGDRFWLKFFDQLFHTIEDDLVSFLKSQIGRRADAAEIERHTLMRRVLDDAVASDPRARVYAKDNFWLHISTIINRKFIVNNDSSAKIAEESFHKM